MRPMLRRVLASRDGKAAVMAAVVFGAGFVLLYSGAYASEDSAVPWAATQYGFPAQVLVVTLAMVCLGVALRYRFPLAVLVVGTVGFVADVLMGASLATILIYTDNIYAACVYGPRSMWRLLLMIATAASIAVGGAVYAVQQQLGGSLVFMVVIAAVLVTPVVTAAVVRQNRDRAEDQRVRADQLARMAELDRRQAVAAERNRMARELHDAIANRLSVIVLQSTALLSREDLDAETRRRLLATIHDDGVQGLDELRTMIGVLRDDEEEEPVTAAPRGLPAVQALVDGLGDEARLTVEGEPRPLPAAVELASFRIVQEAVTNALKHGGGPADVRLAYREEGVELQIENRLPGAAPARLPGGGLGLPGMRERAEALGGRFTAGEAPGDRWRVEAVLPAPSAKEVHR